MKKKQIKRREQWKINKIKNTQESIDTLEDSDRKHHDDPHVISFFSSSTMSIPKMFCILLSFHFTYSTMDPRHISNS